MQGSVVDRALLNLRAPKAACKLMKFYAARSEGFRPSLKVIYEETGIDAHNVSRCRALLMRYGLIGYNGRTVIIDWVRLRALASMEPKLMGQKSNWQITPVDVNLLGQPKNDVHTYIGTENLIFGPDGFQDSVGWYSPFDEPDPQWVFQRAIVDAYGEIAAYAHYDTLLPF